MEAIAFVFSCGAKPMLTGYSPIPGTKPWEEHTALYSATADEPLWHNNSLLGYYPQRRPELLQLKQLVNTINLDLQQGINLFNNGGLSRQFRSITGKHKT